MTTPSRLASASGGELAVAWVFLAAILAPFVVIWVAMWRVFAKAGESGWTALIAIYNFVVVLRIVRRPWWWLLLLFVPTAGVVDFRRGACGVGFVGPRRG